MQFLSLVEKLLKKPFDEFIQGKEDRYWINQRSERKRKFLYDPSILVDHHYTVDGNTWKGIDKFILFNEN